MARKFVSPQRAPKFEPPRSASSFNSLNFLRNPQNPPRASGEWRHLHFVTRFIISGYCDISVWQIRSVRAHALPPASSLHLTNPKGMHRNPLAIASHNRNTWVRTPVALLCPLSGKFPWERHEPPYLPIYGWNSTTTVLFKMVGLALNNPWRLICH